MLAYQEPKVLENLKLKIKKSIPDYNVKFKSAIHKVWKVNSIYTKDIEKFFLNIKKKFSLYSLILSVIKIKMAPI